MILLPQYRFRAEGTMLIESSSAAAEPFGVVAPFRDQSLFPSGVSSSEGLVLEQYYSPTGAADGGEASPESRLKVGSQWLPIDGHALKDQFGPGFGSTPEHADESTGQHESTGAASASPHGQRRGSPTAVRKLLSPLELAVGGPLILDQHQDRSSSTPLPSPRESSGRRSVRDWVQASRDALWVFSSRAAEKLMSFSETLIPDTDDLPPIEDEASRLSRGGGGRESHHFSGPSAEQVGRWGSSTGGRDANKERVLRQVLSDRAVASEALLRHRPASPSPVGSGTPSMSKPSSAAELQSGQ